MKTGDESKERKWYPLVKSPKYTYKNNSECLYITSKAPYKIYIFLR